jgi:hypothetical protein
MDNIEFHHFVKILIQWNMFQFRFRFEIVINIIVVWLNHRSFHVCNLFISFHLMSMKSNQFKIRIEIKWWLIVNFDTISELKVSVKGNSIFYGKERGIEAEISASVWGLLVWTSKLNRKSIKRKKNNTRYGIWKSELWSQMSSKSLTEFRMCVLLAVNFGRPARNKRERKMEFWKLSISREWMISQNVFNLSKSGKCRGKIEMERKKENYRPNHSVMSIIPFVFWKSQHEALILLLQLQRTCNGIIWETAMPQR